MTKATEAFEKLREGFEEDKEWFGRGLAFGLSSLMEATMWKLKPGKDGLEYQDRKKKIELQRDSDLHKTRTYAEGDLRRLYLEYHEEVPGEKSNEPTYPLRGGVEWRKV